MLQSKNQPKHRTQRTDLTIINGGQTGADRGGLLGAATLGIPTGGTAPHGWMTEHGSDPSLALVKLVEGPKGKSLGHTYILRTEQNIINSDGTVVFGNIDPVRDRGSYRTVELCKKHSKPYLHISISELKQGLSQCAEKLRRWVIDESIQTLNVAGNRESKCKGLEKAVAKVVQEAFEQKLERSLLEKVHLEKPKSRGELEALITTRQGKGGSFGFIGKDAVLGAERIYTGRDFPPFGLKASPLANNAYKVKAHTEAEHTKAVRLYRKWLDQEMAKGKASVAFREVDRIADKLLKGEKVVLTCFCPPHLPCHAKDVVQSKVVERALEKQQQLPLQQSQQIQSNQPTQAHVESMNKSIVAVYSDGGLPNALIDMEPKPDRSAVNPRQKWLNVARAKQSQQSSSTGRRSPKQVEL